MAKITNFSRGLRGISLKDGTTVWLEPGESADIEKKDVAGALPDLGQKADAPVSDDKALDDLKAQVEDLTKQVETLTGANKALTVERDGLVKDKTDLTKQVETLTKPAK